VSGLTRSMRPALAVMRTPRAQPEGSSADSNHKLAMEYIIPSSAAATSASETDRE